MVRVPYKISREKGFGMLGIVTVTYNSESVIDEFLESMDRQLNNDWRLYVVDNASRDATLAKVCDRYGKNDRVIVIANTVNVGVAVGNNLGIRAALDDGCGSVMLLNNDTVFAEDLFSGMVAEQDRLGADMLIPKMKYFDPPTRLWCAGGGFRRLRAISIVHYGEDEEDIGQYDEAQQIEYSPTCCMLIRKSVFDKIGLMDENFFVYCDDSDFCYRAFRSGLSLWYSPAQVLYHKVSSLTGGQSDFSLFNVTYGRVYMIRKHLRATAFWWLLLYQILFVVRIVMPGYGWKRFLLLRKAYRDGVARAI